MKDTRVVLNQLENELEITIRIPLQPFIKLLLEKTEPPKQLVKEDAILSPNEACTFLRISSSTLWRWKKTGKLKYILRGSRYFFKKSSLEELNVERRLSGVNY